MQGGLDGLPSSLLICSDSLLFSLNQSQFFFPVRPKTSADILRTADFRFSYKVSAVGLPVQVDLFIFY